MNALLGMVEPPWQRLGANLIVPDEVVLGQDGIDWDGMRMGNGWCWFWSSNSPYGIFVRSIIIIRRVGLNVDY